MRVGTCSQGLSTNLGSFVDFVYFLVNVTPPRRGGPVAALLLEVPS
jgi:hypothetical protein